MSFSPTTFRPLAKMGWGGRCEFRGLVQTDDKSNTGRTVVNRGQIGQPVYRSTGIVINARIAGVSRDSAGAILGNCKVSLLQSGGLILVAETTSDASGNYAFDNPGSGPFLVLGYKAGSPNVDGVTDSNLIAVQV
jgi:hypothetical protein